MQKVDRRTPLPGLTALRFFAATYVLVFHLFPIAHRTHQHPVLWQRLLDAGFTGVSCFFVLSGFILAYTHPQVSNPRKFYRARFARVYPLYLFALILALPYFLRQLVHLGDYPKLWAIPADLLLIQNWFPSLALEINTPAWTLSCEAFFYLLFPLLITRRWLRSPHPAALIALIWLLQILPPILTNYWIAPIFPAWAPLCHDLLFTPLLRLGEFLAGIVLGLAFLQRGQSASSPGQSPAWLTWLSLGSCVAFLSLNLRVPHEVVRNGLMLGPFCLLIWALATRHSRFLASRPLQLGGEISYGVYLLQAPLSHVLYTILGHMPFSFLHSPAWIVLIYPFSWLTYTRIEKPCRAWLLHRAPSRSEKPIPTPQPELP